MATAWSDRKVTLRYASCYTRALCVECGRASTHIHNTCVLTWMRLRSSLRQVINHLLQMSYLCHSRGAPGVCFKLEACVICECVAMLPHVQHYLLNLYSIQSIHLTDTNTHTRARTRHNTKNNKSTHGKQWMLLRGFLTHEPAARTRINSGNKQHGLLLWTLLKQTQHTHARARTVDYYYWYYWSARTRPEISLFLCLVRLPAVLLLLLFCLLRTYMAWTYALKGDPAPDNNIMKSKRVRRRRWPLATQLRNPTMCYTNSQSCTRQFFSRIGCQLFDGYSRIYTHVRECLHVPCLTGVCVCLCVRVCVSVCVCYARTEFAAKVVVFRVRV